MTTPWTDKKIQERMKLKVGLAEMLKGGCIMDVTNAEQAQIAEEAGAVAVMALERIPADIRRDGGIARMSQPKMINWATCCHPRRDGTVSLPPGPRVHPPDSV